VYEYEPPEADENNMKINDVANETAKTFKKNSDKVGDKLALANKLV